MEFYMYILNANVWQNVTKLFSVGVGYPILDICTCFEGE